MKGVGILVPSLRGVNFRFWSHFGKHYLYVAVKISFKVPREEARKITCLICFKCGLFKGSKKILGYAMICLLSKFLMR